jgi:glutamine amidotransferase
MIGIVNYGMGNLASVKNALDYLSIPSIIIADPLELATVDKIILPGVGAFGMAMQNLNNTGFSLALKELVLEKKVPILGVCLGMQLLLASSTEHGNHEGLGIIDGKVLFFGEVTKDLPIPHMGWNEVEYAANSLLFKNIDSSPDYYFVHSYYCQLSEPGYAVGITSYGIDFHSSLEKEHIFGCQFHPEKSQKSGLAIFKNFNTI